eukprot:1333925-Amphidinium_carterae.1
MGSAVSAPCRSTLFIADDRDTGKVWRMEVEEMGAVLLSQVLQDPAWQHLPQLTPHDVLVWHVVQAEWGLPKWLRGHPRSNTWCAPWVFPLVKSKCYEDTGKRKCNKPGHSCWRRVIACSAVPYRRAWRVLSRAVRGVVRLSNIGREVFSMAEVAQSIGSMLQSLHPPIAVHACCLQCCCPLHQATVLTCDIDQAYESCGPGKVIPAWTQICEFFHARTGADGMLVKKCKRDCVQPAVAGAATRSYWRLKLPLVTRALASYVQMTLVVVLGQVFQLKGLAIGGLMSAAALAVVLAYEECMWFQRYPSGTDQPAPLRLRHINWLRYVDDIVCVSHTYCAECCFKHLCLCYSMPLTACSGLRAQENVPHIWLDVEFIAVGHAIVTRLKNDNREWLLNPHTERKKTLFPPWPGTLPFPLAQFRNVLWSRCRRGHCLGLSDDLCALRVLEDVCELSHLGYPPRVLRDILHVLPCVPATRLVRQWGIAWLRA